MSIPVLKPSHASVEGPVILAILDGVGIAPEDDANAVARAHTPNLDRYAQSPLATHLFAHGTAVGLPSDADMGNSEVGHNAMGAGRVIPQGAKLVNEAIASGAIYRAETWRHLISQCRSHQSPLHLIGLLSDGNVHSHIEHLFALIRQADREGVEQLYVHALLDGRDVPKTSALTYVDALEDVLASINSKPQRTYRIASGGGRMHITMDRYEADWPMVQRGWHTHVHGKGRQFAGAKQAIEAFRSEQPGINDQELPAFVIAKGGKPVGPIRDGASVILFNFRGDRMLELTRAFEDDDFPFFDRSPRPQVAFAGMTLYDGDTHRPKQFLVPPPKIEHTLGELLANAGVSQLAISETQKFGHVTYFWNGNRSGCFSQDTEKYIEIKSYPAPFDANPAMRAAEISQAVEQAMQQHPYRFVRLNFANGDMVGHTGNFAATVQSMEAVDAALAPLEQLARSRNGCLIITADHGNAEDMGERDKSGALKRDEQGNIIPKTSHSLNPVPFYVVANPSLAERLTLIPMENPGLANIAATVTTLLGYTPAEHFLPSLVAWKG